MSTTHSLEARIQRLEDIEAIENLTATYAFYFDKGKRVIIIKIENEQRNYENSFKSF